MSGAVRTVEVKQERSRDAVGEGERRYGGRLGGEVRVRGVVEVEEGREGVLRTIEKAFPYLEEICVGESPVWGEVGLEGGKGFFTGWFIW